MSISQQLIQLAQNVGALTADTNAIFEALRAKGVNVPANAQLSDVADMIETIELNQTYVTIGGRQYKTVTIGNQEWLAENLDYQFDGVILQTNAWYIENNQSLWSTDRHCGLVYNWNMVVHLNEILLPTGWRVPTKSDGEILVNYVGENNGGTKLKARDKSITSDFPSGWNGTDDYGFCMLPAGNYYMGSFYNQNSIGRIWTSTQVNSDYCNAIFTRNNQSYVRVNNVEIQSALPIRLVKDVT